MLGLLAGGQVAAWTWKGQPTLVVPTLGPARMLCAGGACDVPGVGRARRLQAPPCAAGRRPDPKPRLHAGRRWCRRRSRGRPGPATTSTTTCGWAPPTRPRCWTLRPRSSARAPRARGPGSACMPTSRCSEALRAPRRGQQTHKPVTVYSCNIVCLWGPCPQLTNVVLQCDPCVPVSEVCVSESERMQTKASQKGMPASPSTSLC